MKTKIFTIAILLISSVLLSQVPQTMDYSGKLTDDNGSFINGQVDLTFKLYDVATGGAALWQETQSAINVSNGYFHVQLGSDSTFTAGLFHNTDLWLGTEVNNDNEMTPRSKLASVAFSQKADNGVPVGAVMPFMGVNAPAGWLVCNGQSIATGDEYADLRAVIGNTVPDLRGEFLRGWDNGRGRDPDANSRNGGDNVGSIQNDLFLSHNHGGVVTGGEHQHNYNGVGGHPYNYAGSYATVQILDFNSTKQASVPTSGSGHQHTISSDGGNETRPKNVYVNFIIKY
ncbi:MAG: tail fiber protein [Bacteroidales bacterium]|nr:tail fiber protein [Bacteroidales bacterium]